MRRQGQYTRMGKHNAFELRSVLAIGLMMSSICISTQAQQGFLSIDCGGTPYTDAHTTLSWEGDANYIKTGSMGRVTATVNSSDENPGPLQTFTYFPERRSKHCYVLPTRVNVNFLLRAMFLHGNSAELILPVVFSVAVNGTVWSNVAYTLADTADTLSTPIIIEGIFFSPGTFTYFCLVPATGIPFVSSLELRELDQYGIMYSNGGLSATRFLNSLVRFNCGADLTVPTVRYPDDKYDRLWYTPGSSYQTIPSYRSSKLALQPALDGLNDIPTAVMQSAWGSDFGGSILASFNLGSSVSTAYIALYFQELSDAAHLRHLDIYVDRVYTANMTVGTIPNARYYWNWPVGANVEFSLVKESDSYYDPILNAIEVYAEVDFNTSATATTDVDALTTLQVSFNLTTWQGDPCYPVSWEWAACTSGGQARVTALLLSNMGIDSSIPSTISNLGALTEIRLDNNSLYGVIPASLALLPNLMFLSLQNNNLSGNIPPSLVAKLGSNFQYSGNRLLGSAPGLPPESPPEVPLGSSPGLAPGLTSIAKKKSSSVGVIVGAIVGALLGLGILLGILIWFFKGRKIPPPKPFEPEIGMVRRLGEVGRISYESVKIATKNFQTKVGQGSFGPVYIGLLNDSEVAVKVNSIQSSQGRKEFIAEVDILTRVHHKNLVSLVGYCDDANGLILVYEFQSNGTLNEWIHGKSKSLDWKQRLAIATDAAKGLEYLHTGCNPTIIHRDVKTSNILLDSSMTAKVADFGLSKSAPCERSSGFSTGVKGTFGYLDPEYNKMGRLTLKSDIYSFGVVLAELMTGRLPFQHPTDDGPGVILLDWMRKMMETNHIEALADPNLQGQFDPGSMWRVADLALSCVNPISAKRPDFSQVVIGLNEATEAHNRTIFTTHSPLQSVPSSYFEFISRPSDNHPYLNLTDY